MDLIRTGKTASRGKVALANGTTNGMPAYGLTDKNSTNSGGIIGGKKNPTTTTTTTSDSPKDSTTRDNTSALKKVSSTLDKFNNIFSDVMDWVEVKLNRLQEALDRNSNRIDNATYLHTGERNVGYINSKHEKGKNDYV
jgi:hypothetical protein